MYDPFLVTNVLIIRFTQLFSFFPGTSNVYSEPYSQYVDSDPSVEQMYEVVVIRHLRPPIHPEWSKNDVSRVMLMLITLLDV